MQYEIYSKIRFNKEFNVFDFTSVGPKGEIAKRIAFQATDYPNIYNLAFGDVANDDTIDDFNISNNGDRNKIIATVANVVEGYTKKFPERLVFFRGSTIERTRLYRMAIGLNLNELAAKFDIFAYVNQRFVPFTKNIKAEGFLFKRKIL